MLWSGRVRAGSASRFDSPVRLTTEAGRAQDPAVSPDGHWVAYAASEFGRPDVYVAPFPGPGGKQQISSAGGSYPRWRSDGKELFYHSLDNRLMAATVRVDAARVEVDAIRPLFELRAPDGLPRNFYDVASDGQRFMIIVPDDTASTALTLVSNWPTLVKASR